MAGAAGQRPGHEVAGSRHGDWLLRNACDGGFLNRYFAGTVATAAHLLAAITRPEPDAALVDHTSRLLIVMSGRRHGRDTRHVPARGPRAGGPRRGAGHAAADPDRYRAATRLAEVLAHGRWLEPLRRYRALLARPAGVAVSPPGVMSAVRLLAAPGETPSTRLKARANAASER